MIVSPQEPLGLAMGEFDLYVRKRRDIETPIGGCISSRSPKKKKNVVQPLCCHFAWSLSTALLLFCIPGTLFGCISMILCVSITCLCVSIFVRLWACSGAKSVSRRAGVKRRTRPVSRLPDNQGQRARSALRVRSSQRHQSSRVRRTRRGINRTHLCSLPLYTGNIPFVYSSLTNVLLNVLVLILTVSLHWSSMRWSWLYSDWDTHPLSVRCVLFLTSRSMSFVLATVFF